MSRGVTPAIHTNERAPSLEATRCAPRAATAASAGRPPATRADAKAEPTCGQGPFSMASADTTTDVLVRAGFEDVSLHRCDIEITIGADLDNAVEFVMALGPAGELIRLAGLQAEELHSNIVAALNEALAEFQGADGSAIRAPASSWVVGARVR
jgi:hypothetical protein